MGIFVLEQVYNHDRFCDQIYWIKLKYPGHVSIQKRRRQTIEKNHRSKGSRTDQKLDAEGEIDKWTGLHMHTRGSRLTQNR